MALLGPTGRHRESLIIGFQRTLLAVSRRTAQGCIGPRREVIFRRLPSCSLSRVERAERPVDTIYRSGLLGATQACTAVFEKHLSLRPVHADGIAAVPVQRGLAHLIKDAHADGRRLRHLNDRAGVPFI